MATLPAPKKHSDLATKVGHLATHKVVLDVYDDYMGKYASNVCATRSKIIDTPQERSTPGFAFHAKKGS